MTKILLVEDDKSLREIYGVRLQAEGYEIVSAGDGEEALAMAIKERPQLILSDVMMPKISGFDMLDILRSTTETKDIKVIMMTALSSEDQRQRGESLGADKYLVKSQVGIEDVVRTVHEVLGDTPAAASGGNVFAQPTGPRTSMPTAGMQSGAPQAGATAPSQPPQAAPQAAPAPQAPAAPSAPPQPPAPAQQPAQPQAPAPAPQPTPQPQPVAPTAPSAPPTRLPADSTPNRAPSSGPQESALPRPTAPFSTDRPAGLGDRIIHPIEQSADGKKDLNALMAQELGSAPTSPSATPPQPPAPAPQPTPQPQPVAPTAPSAPPQPPAPAQQPPQPQAAPQSPQPQAPPAPAAPSAPPSPPQQQP